MQRLGASLPTGRELKLHLGELVSIQRKDHPADPASARAQDAGGHLTSKGWVLQGGAELQGRWMEVGKQARGPQEPALC